MTDRTESAQEAVWLSRVIAHDDHEAFARLVRLHQSAVRQFLRRLLGHDWSRADDLAQETFWKAYRHIGSFQGRGRFLGWLFRIAYQLFLTELRRRPQDAPMPDELVDPRDSTEALIDRGSFDQLMLMLRPSERAAIELHYRYEMAHPEIAEALELPIGTVKTLIRRGRQRLAAHCQQTSEDAPR